jgi:hypothetical protein
MRLKTYRYSATRGLEKIKTKTAIVLSTVMLAVSGGTGLSLAIFGSAHASPVPSVVYDSLASVSPQTNYPSQPFQAQQTTVMLLASTGLLQ